MYRNIFRDHLLAKWICLTFLCLVHVGCGNDKDQGEKRRLDEAHEHHIVKKSNYWKGKKSKNFIDRIKPATPELIDYLTLDNQIYGYKERPKRVDIDNSFKKRLFEAIATMPVQVVEQASPHLICIAIVEELGSSGFCQAVYDERKKLYGSILILDQEVLNNKKANEWATWKENSAFRKILGVSLKLTLAEEENDTITQAIQFLLIHELAHVIGPAIGAHPIRHWDDPSSFPFTTISWESLECSKHDLVMPNRKDITYYRLEESKLSVADAVSVIRNLNKTDFVSLYSSIHPWEDFGEAYAIYVHQVLMKKIYKIEIIEDRTSKVLPSSDGYQHVRMDEKKAYFDRLFSR